MREFKSERHHALSNHFPPDLKKLLSSGAMEGPRLRKPSFQPAVVCRPVPWWLRAWRAALLMGRGGKSKPNNRQEKS